METFKVGICEPLDFSKKAIENLSKKCEVFFFDGYDLRAFVQNMDAIFVRLKYQITDELLGKNPRLKYICSPTTGLNHISVINNNIKIVSLKGEYKFLDSIRATPEHVFGLSIALLRNYAHAFLNSQNIEWNRDLYKGFELYDNSIGIIGLGRVGRLLAGYYTAFGAQVGYCDISANSKVDGLKQYKSLAELINASKIIILAANYTDENRKMIGEKEFFMMKDKYFINAARGELVDEPALLKRVKDNWFRGVAIDVLTNETQESFFLQELLKLTEDRNLIITPHIGGATISSMERTEEFVSEKFLDILAQM